MSKLVAITEDVVDGAKDGLRATDDLGRARRQNRGAMNGSGSGSGGVRSDGKSGERDERGRLRVGGGSWRSLGLRMREVDLVRREQCKCKYEVFRRDESMCVRIPKKGGK